MQEDVKQNVSMQRRARLRAASVISVDSSCQRPGCSAFQPQRVPLALLFVLFLSFTSLSCILSCPTAAAATSLFYPPLVLSFASPSVTLSLSLSLFFFWLFPLRHALSFPLPQGLSACNNPINESARVVRLRPHETKNTANELIFSAGVKLVSLTLKLRS